MINLLGIESNQIGSYILIGVLVLLLVGYAFFGMRVKKKNQEKAIQMLNELKAGDKVVTNAGIYGEIVSIRETNMGKVVTIKTGDDETKKISYMTINADLILDKDGNVIDDDEGKEELKKEILKDTSKSEETKSETKSESKSLEEKADEKPEDNEIINKIKKKSSSNSKK